MVDKYCNHVSSRVLGFPPSTCSLTTHSCVFKCYTETPEKSVHLCPASNLDEDLAKKVRDFNFQKLKYNLEDKAK